MPQTCRRSVGGTIVGGAIVGGAFVGGAIVGGATVGGATVGGAPVGGAFDVGANVAEQMSRSNCRVLRSKCRRSNRRRSMCHGTVYFAIEKHLDVSPVRQFSPMNPGGQIQVPD